MEKYVSSVHFTTAFDVGELCETSGEIEVEWKIANIFALCEEKDDIHTSSKFYFSDNAWSLGIQTKDPTVNRSTEFLVLYINRMAAHPAISLTYSFSLINTVGKKEKTNRNEVIFDKDNNVSICPLLHMSSLEEKKSILAPCDVVTIHCTLKHRNRTANGLSLIRRLMQLSFDLRNLLIERKRTDVVFKVKEEEFPAHRSILQSRSPVFSAMFHHHMEENKTGVVRIDDIQPDIFNYVLTFIYSGRIPVESFENIFPVYSAADKYQLTDLKQLCKAVIEDNLSVNLICDVIEFADLYKDEELEQRARKYFKEHLKTILKTENWKAFVKENHELSMEVLSFAVNELD